jgi:predicted CoA-binding protein
MTDVATILAAAKAFLVVDWPSKDVPEALARAGYEVVVHGGPGPEDFTAYELVGDEVVDRHVGRLPERADVVYTFRPLAELDELVEVALGLGATAVWVQSGVTVDGDKDPTGCWMPAADSAMARAKVEAAGLAYVDRPYIVDALAAAGA